MGNILFAFLKFPLDSSPIIHSCNKHDIDISEPVESKGLAKGSISCVDWKNLHDTNLQGDMYVMPATRSRVHHRNNFSLNSAAFALTRNKSSLSV